MTKANCCFLCDKFLAEFPTNYDYVHFELGIGYQEVHETCLQKTSYPFISLKDASKRHIKFLENGWKKL